MGNKKSFVFYYDWRDILEPFDDIRLSRLIRSILKYAVDGEETTFDDLALTVSYNFIIKTIMRDSEKYSQVCEKRKEIGKLGGRQKGINHSVESNHKNNSKSNQLLSVGCEIANEVNLPDNENVNENENVNDNVNVNDINISSFSSKTVCIYSDDFLEFWKEYPKKVGKGEAYKRWKTLRLSSADKSDILNALKWQKRSELWKKSGGQFIPNPSTYISQRRWEDEPLTISTDITDPDRYNDGDELPEYIMKGGF